MPRPKVEVERSMLGDSPRLTAHHEGYTLTYLINHHGKPVEVARSGPNVRMRGKGTYIPTTTYDAMIEELREKADWINWDHVRAAPYARASAAYLD